MPFVTGPGLEPYPLTFKTAAVTAAGSTAIWTPAAGKRFRLLAVEVEVTDNAIQAVAGVDTLALLDVAAAVGMSWSVFIGTVALTGGVPLLETGWLVLPQPGYLAAAVNNVLNLNLGTALTGGTVRINTVGTEE